jgi:hypothetical protein
MIVEKIIFTIISVKNLLIVNLLILYYRNINCKILIFYHPKDDLKNISYYHIKKLLKFKNSKKIKIIILDNSKINAYRINYIKQYFLKYINGVDLFLSNYVCDTFPNKCQRIYLHHDIYDTPLVNPKKEKELFKRLNKYDHILLPSIKSKKIFNKLTLNYKNKKIKLSIIGYFKLDHLKRTILNFKEKKTKNIVIAPTNKYIFPQMSLINKIEKIFYEILKRTNYNIIFRPHPSNFNDKNIIELNKKFIENERVKFDNSKNYLNTYMNSDIMISDLSGTAYTYSFLTNQPTIFFSNYEKKLKKLNYNILNYFKDRNKIGYIVKNEKELIRILLNKNIYKNKRKIIKKILSSTFKVGKAKLLFDNFIYKVL